MTVPLDFNNVVGLTHWVRQIDGHKMVLALRRKPTQWCVDTLGYLPKLKVTKGMASVVLYFEEDSDKLLFKIAFAQHFMPAAMNFMPFSLDD